MPTINIVMSVIGNSANNVDSLLDFKGMDREQIEKRIEKAFSGLNYPGNQDLTVHPLGLDECFYESL